MLKSSVICISVLLTGLFSLTACGSAPQEPPVTPTRHFTNPAFKAYADKEFAVYDPAEGVNKQIYKFNAGLDEYFLLPVVGAYTGVTPKFVRTGVSNFFLNVGEVNNFANSVLQVNPKKAGITLTRFVVNTTAGLLGTIDVATRIGIERQQEDFGKTLAHYGAGTGAYVVLPVLGPSNVRDTIGTIVDYGTFVFIIPEDIQHTVPYEVIDYGLQPVNLRYSNDFRYYSSGSPFEYELVRYISTQRRSAQIEKERKE
jgi:phospholipid-binding lipoprotein MlaA